MGREVSILESLKPVNHKRVMDLVAAAGLDTSDWSNYNGPEPAANPKYCYEWSFLGDDRVVLNLWLHDMREDSDGAVSYAMNPRVFARAASSSIVRNRAERLDTALQIAKNRGLPVRVIVCESADRSNLGDLRAARVRGRSLVPVQWRVEVYDVSSGDAVLMRNPEMVSRSRVVWGQDEVRATVDDYLRMLRMELSGQRYNKSAHREMLKKVLSDRSDSAIEMKHQNISAVLLDLGVMSINGYKPLPNYQQRLFEIVTERIAADTALDRIALEAAERPAEPRGDVALDDLLVPKPIVPASGVREDRTRSRSRVGIHRDYLERESRNRELGASGEILAVQYEIHRLHSAGKKQLAERVEHVSRSRGDGLGFDVLSFDASGRERYVEVKTTAFSSLTPFFVSANEVEFSSEVPEQYWIYRIFDYRDEPRMFQLTGAIGASCRLDPLSFRASPL